MIDCPLKQLDDGRWWCAECDLDKKRLLPVKARRNCRAMSADEKRWWDGFERAKQAVDSFSHYTRALARWIAAGRPVRTDWEVASIHSQYCYPCQEHYDPEKEICTACGCKVRRQGMAVRNKIKMATESCPTGKW